MTNPPAAPNSPKPRSASSAHSSIGGLPVAPVQIVPLPAGAVQTVPLRGQAAARAEHLVSTSTHAIAAEGVAPTKGPDRSPDPNAPAPAPAVRVLRWKQPGATPVGAAAPSSDPAPRTRTDREPLAELVDRASAQMMILRRTLDEAQVLGNAARRASDDLASNLAHVQQAQSEIDARMGRAAAGLRVLDSARETLHALDEVVSRIRTVKDGLGQEFDNRLREQASRFERHIEELGREWAARLERQHEAWTQRLSRLERLVNERFEEAERELPSRVELLKSSSIVEIEQACEEVRAAAGAAEKSADGALRAARAESDRIAAGLERLASQAQARASLALDSAQERVQELEQRSAQIEAGTRQRLNEMAHEAATTLGVEVRSLSSEQGWRDRPRPGSLAELVLQAEGTLHELRKSGDQARQALATAREQWGTLDASARQAAAEVREALGRSEGRVLLLQSCIEQATRQAEDMMLAARSLGALVDCSRRTDPAAADAPQAPVSPPILKSAA